MAAKLEYNATTLVSNFTTFQALLDSFGGNAVELLIVKEITLLQHTIVPSNIGLRFTGKGEINNGGFNLTINGPINAGLKQIFSGGGIVSFEGVKYPEWWAGKPDGVIDFTDAINACLNDSNSTVVFSNQSAHYMYSAESSVDNSNISIFGYGATLQAMPTSGTAYGIRISGPVGAGATPVSNIRVYGLSIDGDHDGGRVGDEGTSSIAIFNATDVTLMDLILWDAPGDNIHIGVPVINTPTSKRINIQNVKSSGSMRNSCSIVGAEHVSIRSCSFTDAGGGVLNCGIDIEPNFTSSNKYIRISECELTGNDDYGIYINSSVSGSNEHIYVVSNTDISDNTMGVYARSYGENVFVEGNYISNNSQHGVLMMLAYGKIIGNHIAGNGTYNIRIDALAQHSVVSGNTLVGTGKISFGIQCEASYCNIVGNVVFDHFKHGIFVASGADYCKVGDNVVHGGVTGDVNYELLGVGGDYCNVSGNECYSSEGETGSRGVVLGGAGAKVTNNSCVNAKLLVGGQFYQVAEAPFVAYSRGNWDGTLGYAIDFVPSEEIDSDVALAVGVPSNLDSSGGVLALTLADGVYNGQEKLITMSVAGNNANVTIAHHLTSDDEVALFDAVGEFLLLRWVGADWITIANTCTFP